MSFGNSAVAYLLRPRVVHRLPGRVRVHFPLMKRLRHEANGETVELAARLLSVPDGIDEVAPSVTTGNVLIRYDAERLTADDVLGYVDALTQLCVANRDVLRGLSPDMLCAREARLGEWLRERLNDRLELDDTLRIPEDVLA